MPRIDRAGPPWPHDPTLTLADVSASRGGRPVLVGVSIDFTPGSRTVILGRSGAGKSTLLRLLNRLAEPDSGRIAIAATPIGSYPATLVRRRIGLVPQAPRPLPGTVLDNLNYPLTLTGEAEPTPAADALAEVGLDADADWLDRDAAGLSGGERQRLAVATTLRARPAILVLDEPTSALDLDSARHLAESLRLRSARDGLTTIAVTHDRDAARLLGDRAIRLDAGRVADLGPTADVLDRTDSG